MPTTRSDKYMKLRVNNIILWTHKWTHKKEKQRVTKILVILSGVCWCVSGFFFPWYFSSSSSSSSSSFQRTRAAFRLDLDSWSILPLSTRLFHPCSSSLNLWSATWREWSESSVMYWYACLPFRHLSIADLCNLFMQCIDITFRRFGYL